MPAKKSGIKTAKPKSAWTKPLKADLIDLFKALSKSVIHASSGNSYELVADAADAAKSLGLQTEPGELAFSLIKSSINKAILDLLNEGTPLNLQTDAEALENLTKRMDFSCVTKDIEIDRDFLRQPAKLSIVSLISLLLEQWLVTHQLEQHLAKAVVRRFPVYFTYALNTLWRKHAKSLAALREALDTPFSAAAEREDAWKEYNALLHRRANEGVFGDAFGLQDLYVPLNAWSLDKRKKGSNQSDAAKAPAFDQQQAADHSERYVFDLKEQLTAWVEGKDQVSLCLRIISGGPGSGKSTALKILAAEWAANGHRVVFIPLHLLPEPSGDVIGDVWLYLKELGFFVENPLESCLGENVILIFDGLDELASRGRVATEVAQSFIRSVDAAATRRNEANFRVRVLVTGRELVIQENEIEFSRPKQILHLLPYFMSKDEISKHSWVDPKALLSIDLRNYWWEKYGALLGENWNSLPAELQRVDLEEVTGQPLLNYLVALTKVRGQLDLSKEVNINAIYGDLVAAVHERGYEKTKHATVRHMTLVDFIRVLEEVAIAAWHGSDGRTTTVKEIEEHCRTSGVGRLLDSFKDGAKAGVTRLLAAFFFRKQGHDTAGDDTFEFTHKSFGEYLTACRLSRGLDRTVRECKKREESLDEGWDERQALEHWLQLTGPTTMSAYLYRLLTNEIIFKEREVLLVWQTTLASLFAYVLRNGSPINIGQNTRISQLFIYSRNSEEALLAAVNACSRGTGELSDFDLQSPTVFGSWFKRVQGQRSGSENPLVARCLIGVSPRYLTFSLSLPPTPR